MEEKKRVKDSLAEEVLRRLQLLEEVTGDLIKLSEPEMRDQNLLSRTGAEFIYRAVTEDVCRKCPRYRECYEEKKEKTFFEISRILEQASVAARVDGKMASGEFRKQCVYFQSFVEELSWLFRMLYQNYRWEKRMMEMGQVMHKQMIAQNLFIAECRRILSEGRLITGAKKRKIYLALLRRRVHCIEGQEYTDESGLLHVNLALRPLAGNVKTSVVTKCLSEVYGKVFQCVRRETWLRPGMSRIVFVEESSFQVLFGYCHCSKTGETVCGDTFSFLNYGRKRAIMLLSDGMGVGETAYLDSKKLIEAFESMMEAGIHEEFALQILHNTLLAQNKTEFSTLDAAIISLRTGMVKFLKAGGAAAFIRHGKSVERIGGKSLPPGCLDDQQFDICCKKMYDGDVAILLSDGMLDFENMESSTCRMEDILAGIRTKNAQTFASQLMEAVPTSESGHEDDRTVLVAALWERGHGVARI